MKTFVVYEIWTRSRLVQAASISDALDTPPEEVVGLNLANWHAVEVSGDDDPTP